MKPLIKKNRIADILNVCVVACGAVFFAACGEDGTTEKITDVAHSGLDVVSDVAMLPACTVQNEREIVWVKGELTPRMCSDGKWYAVAEGSVAATCTAQELNDGSGVKIVCGGDSVGVVYNGHDGKEGEPGQKGAVGDKGEDGAKGAAGMNGADGKDGLNGRDGVDGNPGINGKDGVDGKDGAPGADGKDGSDGHDGNPGVAGKDGSDGKDGKDGINCFVEEMEELYVRVICGEDSTVLYVGSVPDTTIQDTVELDSEKIAVALDQVSGVTQKGPFLNGSKVLVREMEDGRSLTQTGNSFNGKILNDRGEFKINARMLVSQYVMLEATGYYRNEVTGENSNSELTLFAITDVNDRNIVNVNLLTHLEYERVIYLVTKKKMKVRAAKKQAQKEVFALLNIDATNFSNSEDLNLAGSSDEDGALLAFSAVLQGDRSVAELSELLTRIASDMEKDGEWNDAETRLAIARWAAVADSADRLDVIRDNVKKWGISAMVPNFEKYIRHFWTTEYGLDSCNANRLGNVVSAKPDVHSDTRSRFICKEDSAGFRWYFASNLEKDTYLWNDTTDGALKNGLVTNSVYVFDSIGFEGVRGWRATDWLERAFGGCCVAMYGEFAREGGFEYKDGRFYQCQEASRRWVEFDNGLYVETHKWPAKEDGFAQWGEMDYYYYNYGRKCYVYDTSSTNKGWRYSYVFENDRYVNLDSTNACENGLGGCTKGRLNSIKKGDDGEYYRCVVQYVVQYDTLRDVYYWAHLENHLLENSDIACLDSNSGEIRPGIVDADEYFVCEDNYAWRTAGVEERYGCKVNGVCKIERNIGGDCSENGKMTEENGSLLICDNSWPNRGWRLANCAEKKTGKACLKNDSSVVWNCEKVGNFEIDYVCNDGHWHAVRNPWDYTVVDWKKKKAEYYTAENHPDAEYGADLIDVRDNNVYKTVYIEGLRWMAENLRFNGLNAINNSNCYGKCEYELGRNYAWNAAMDVDEKWNYSRAPAGMIKPMHRGICPEGWHIPDTTEWKKLEKASGLSALRMMGFDETAFSPDDEAVDATDSLGFSDFSDGQYDGEGYWSSSEDDAHYFVCRYGCTGIEKGYGRDLRYDFVRCVEDYVANP